LRLGAGHPDGIISAVQSADIRGFGPHYPEGFVSQSTRTKKGPEAPQQNTAMGAVAAIVVVALFVVLGLMLARQPGASTAGQATALPFEAVTAVPADTAAGTAPTVVPAADGAAAGTDAAAVAARANKYSAPPPMTIDPARQYTATITTPRGDIVIRLRPDLAPQTVNSFVFLAREGYYDGVTWHRVLPNFMAQGGDPTGTGGGGPGYTVPGEFTDQVLFDRPGIVAMARPGNDVNGNGSQFFITTAPYPSLNGQYTIFGEVISGQEIVDGIPLRDPEQSPGTPGEPMLTVTVAEG
jgi:peptidylprolyl isomerase